MSIYICVHRFAEIGQSDVGEQLRAALLDGVEGEDGTGNNYFTYFKYLLKPTL